MTHAPKEKFPLFQPHLASSVTETPLYILIQKLLCLHIYYLAALNSKREKNPKDYFQHWSMPLKYTGTVSQNFSMLINASTHLLFQRGHINSSSWPRLLSTGSLERTGGERPPGAAIPLQGLSVCISHNKPPPITQLLQGPLLGNSCWAEAALLLSLWVANKRNYRWLTGRTTLGRAFFFFCKRDFVCPVEQQPSSFSPQIPDTWRGSF